MKRTAVALAESVAVLAVAILQQAAPAADAPAVRRAHVFVSGHVQGVGFRAFVKAEADARKLTGWVMNLADGRVKAVVEGPADKVAELIEKMNAGPRGAKVDKVELADEKPTGEFKGFDVRLK